MGPKLHSELVRTVGIMLWMYETLFSMGKAVVTDIDFCVSYGIVAIVAKGVYYGALMKKRRYWPKNVPGYLINQNFTDKEVVGVDTLEAST